MMSDMKYQRSFCHLRFWRRNLWSAWESIEMVPSKLLLLLGKILALMDKAASKKVQVLDSA